MENNDSANIKNTTDSKANDTTNLENETSKTNDFEYLETKRILGEMLEKKLITKKEYDLEVGKLKELYKPVFDLLTETIF